MTKRTDKKSNETAARPAGGTARRRTAPYLAHRGRGHGAMLEVVDGRNRYSTGISCKLPASKRARRRIMKTVLAKYLRSAADDAG